MQWFGNIHEELSNKEDIIYKTINRYIKCKCGNMDLTSIYFNILNFTLGSCV